LGDQPGTGYLLDLPGVYGLSLKREKPNLSCQNARPEKKNMIRPSWEEYFIEITRLVSLRSTCLRRKVGAVLVKDKNILATGYNGAPSGVAHCLEVGCMRERLGIKSGERHELCRGLHAEQNAIIQAAKHGTNINGSTLYCTTMPCIICSKMIINAGISRIVFEEGYPDSLAGEMIGEAGIDFVRFSELRESAEEVE
jgi:dCMP deaminase